MGSDPIWGRQDFLANEVFSSCLRKRAVTFPTLGRATVGNVPGGSRRRLESLP